MSTISHRISDNDRSPSSIFPRETDPSNQASNINSDITVTIYHWSTNIWYKFFEYERSFYGTSLIPTSVLKTEVCLKVGFCQDSLLLVAKSEEKNGFPGRLLLAQKSEEGFSRSEVRRRVFNVDFSPSSTPKKTKKNKKKKREKKGHREGFWSHRSRKRRKGPWGRLSPPLSLSHQMTNKKNQKMR